MNYASIIKEIGRGAKGSRALEQEQAAELFGKMLDEQVPALELGAILLAFRIKSETQEELLGFKAAMDARTVQLQLPPGPACVVLPSYNGARRQSNLMPLLALLLARSGVPVLIQGRHDFSERSDPFALLAALGIPLAEDVTSAEIALTSTRIAAIDTAQLLPGMAELLALRTRLGVRASAHTMTKLIDPCRGRSVRVVAVTHPEYLERMDQFLLADGGRALLLRGTEGECYANPRRCPRLQAYADGQSWCAAEGDSGGAPPLSGLTDQPEVEANAAQIRAMLAGGLAIPTPILTQVAVLEALAKR